MSGLILSSKVIGEIARIDDTARESRSIIEQAEKDGNETVKAFAVAGAVQAIRSMITPEMMQSIMSLQGSALGFRGDKEYGETIVRDVFIEATLRGFRMIGNEVNIIAGRFYGARDGWKRKVEELPGVSNVVVTMGRVEKNPTTAGTMLVTCQAEWRCFGKPNSLTFSEAGQFDSRLSVKQNNGQSDDAILGKAERKLFKKMYEKISGCSTSFDQDEEPKTQLLGVDEETTFTGEDSYTHYLSEIDRVITPSHVRDVIAKIDSNELLDEDKKSKLVSQANLRIAGMTAKIAREFSGRIDACDFSDTKARKILGDDIADAAAKGRLSEQETNDLREEFAAQVKAAKTNAANSVVV